MAKKKSIKPKAIKPANYEFTVGGNLPDGTRFEQGQAVSPGLPVEHLAVLLSKGYVREEAEKEEKK